jgi:hypothetical protein
MDAKTEPSTSSSSKATPSTTTTASSYKNVFTCHLCQLYAKYDYYGTRPLDRHLLNKPVAELTAEQRTHLLNIVAKKQQQRETLVLLEKCFVCDDPFSQTKGTNYLILGSKCSVCDHMVCPSAECSFFYYKRRFCLKCAAAFIQDEHCDEFPAELRAELAKVIHNNPNLNQEDLAKNETQL